MFKIIFVNLFLLVCLNIYNKKHMNETHLKKKKKDTVKNWKHNFYKIIVR